MLRLNEGLQNKENRLDPKMPLLNKSISSEVVGAPDPDICSKMRQLSLNKIEGLTRQRGALLSLS